MIETSKHQERVILLGVELPDTENFEMSMEELIIARKKKKEELDLEIITKEEFDKFREQLTPIIKGGK